MVIIEFLTQLVELGRINVNYSKSLNIYRATFLLPYPKSEDFIEECIVLGDM